MTVLYFDRHFQTIYRIDANDTPLESYEKPQPCYLTHFFEIPYGLRAVLNIHNYVILEFSFFSGLPKNSKWTSNELICELPNRTYSILIVIFKPFARFKIKCVLFDMSKNKILTVGELSLTKWIFSENPKWTFEIILDF